MLYIYSYIYICYYIYIYIYIFFFSFHTVEYHSAIKKNEFMPFGKNMDGIEDVMLNEVIQTGRDTYYMISHIGRILKTNEQI